MSRREKANIYQSALMVIGIQVVIMILLINSMELGTIYKPDNYLIMIPRLLSCLMMHLTCEDEIRSGLKKMKYILNHPMKFRVYYIIDRETEELRREGLI